MSQPLIDLQHISKSFDGEMVLDDLSLSIKENSFVTLLGPSGCGKSTTLRIIGGFTPPDKGNVIFDGQDITKLPPNKRQLNTVFQKYALFPHMTIAENIAFGLKIKNKPKSYIDDKIKYALKLVNLSGFEKRDVTSLSGGQQQRIAIARAIVNEPRVLLLDEPLGALDLKLRQDMQYELIRLKNELGITFIYVTHDQDEALSMSDIIAVMRSGHIEQIGSPWEIYFRPANRFVADFVGTVNFLTARIVSAEGGTVAADHNGMLLQIPTEVPVEPGETVTLVVRPECIRLAEPGESVPEGKSLEGQIENYSFLGRIIRYWVRVGEEQFIIDDANVDLSGARSGAVQLCLDTRKLHILKDGGSHDT